MAALVADRKTNYKALGTMRHRHRGVGAAAVIYLGAIVAINAAGYLVPASDAAGLSVVGVSEQHVDNTLGGNGALDCAYVTGVEVEVVNAGGAVVQATQRVYAVDDQSVSTIAVTVHDVLVGTIADFDAANVRVYIDEIVAAAGV